MRRSGLGEERRRSARRRTAAGAGAGRSGVGARERKKTSLALGSGVGVVTLRFARFHRVSEVRRSETGDAHFAGSRPARGIGQQFPGPDSKHIQTVELGPEF